MNHFELLLKDDHAMRKLNIYARNVKLDHTNLMLHLLPGLKSSEIIRTGDSAQCGPYPASLIIVLTIQTWKCERYETLELCVKSLQRYFEMYAHTETRTKAARELRESLKDLYESSRKVAQNCATMLHGIADVDKGEALALIRLVRVQATSEDIFEKKLGELLDLGSLQKIIVGQTQQKRTRILDLGSLQKPIVGQTQQKRTRSQLVRNVDTAWDLLVSFLITDDISGSLVRGLSRKLASTCVRFNDSVCSIFQERGDDIIRKRKIIRRSTVSKLGRASDVMTHILLAVFTGSRHAFVQHPSYLFHSSESMSTMNIRCRREGVNSKRAAPLKTRPFI